MVYKKFTANTQYNDFTGTLAADDGDMESITEFLRTNHIINPGEYLLGFRAYCSSIGKGRHFSPYAVVIKTDSHEEVLSFIKNKEGTIDEREINLELTAFSQNSNGSLYACHGMACWMNGSQNGFPRPYQLPPNAPSRLV